MVIKLSDKAAAAQELSYALILAQEICMGYSDVADYRTRLRKHLIFGVMPPHIIIAWFNARQISDVELLKILERRLANWTASE